MLPVLQIGPLALQLPGLLLLLSLWLGLTLSERFAPPRRVSASVLYNLVFAALLAGIVGARLSYILQYPAAFAASPLSAFSLNPDLLDPWGGAAGALLALLILGQRYQLAFWSTLDALTPLLAVLAIGAGLSHLTSGVAFGAPTPLPWGIELWGARRHPTQVYETIAASIILVLLWPGRPALHSWVPGKYFLSFVLLSSLARLFLEAFRGDSLLIPGGLRLVQVLAWLVMAASLWGLKKLSAHARVTDSGAPASKT